MSLRDWTTEEEKTFNRIYKSYFGKSEWKVWTGVLFAIGMFLFLVLFLVSRFLDKKSLSDSLLFGSIGYGFVVVPAVICHIRNVSSKYGRQEAQFKKRLDLDKKEKKVNAKSYDVGKVWRVTDGGEMITLVLIGESQYMCVRREFPSPGNKLNIHSLAHSKCVVSADFSGDAAAFRSRVIDSGNAWRNDDLPYDEVIKYKDFPDEIRKHLD